MQSVRTCSCPMYDPNCRDCRQRKLQAEFAGLPFEERVPNYNKILHRNENNDITAENSGDLNYSDVEKIITLPVGIYATILGYYAEALVPIYINHFGLKVNYDSIVPMIGQTSPKRKIWDRLHKYQCLLYNKLFPQHLDLNISAVLVGLHNDGIDVDKVPT